MGFAAIKPDFKGAGFFVKPVSQNDMRPILLSINSC